MTILLIYGSVILKTVIYQTNDYTEAFFRFFKLIDIHITINYNL